MSDKRRLWYFICTTELGQIEKAIEIYSHRGAEGAMKDE
jgi:hypothetical protein